MSNVIEIENRLRSARRQKEEAERLKKISVVRKFMECTQCMLKCSKCGAQMDLPEAVNRDTSTPYRFCLNCQEEYEEYMKHQLGQANDTLYWYNREWQDIWRNWIEYQKALQNYKDSPEFKKLLRELQSDK